MSPLQRKLRNMRPGTYFLIWDTYTLGIGRQTGAIWRRKGKREADRIWGRLSLSQTTINITQWGDDLDVAPLRVEQLDAVEMLLVMKQCEVAIRMALGENVHE